MKRRADDSKIISFEEMEKRRRQPGKAPVKKPQSPKLSQEFPPLIAYVRIRGAEPEAVEIANLPFNSDGLELFQAMAARDPQGSFRAIDGTPIRFSDVESVPEPRNPENRVRLVLPETGTGRLPEIRVALNDSRDIVSLWNLTDDDLGRAIFESLLEVHGDCDVVTSDFGYVPLRAMKRL